MLYLVNSEDLVNVSEAIRGSEIITAESLEFPQGFINAINAIISSSSGGTLISRFTKTPSSNSTQISFDIGPNKILRAFFLFPPAYLIYTSDTSASSAVHVAPIVYAHYDGETCSGSAMSATTRYSSGAYKGQASLSVLQFTVNYDSSNGTLTITKSSSSIGSFVSGKTYSLYAIFSTQGGSSDGNS